MRIATAVMKLIRNRTWVWLNKFNKTIKLVLQPNLIEFILPSFEERYLSTDFFEQDVNDDRNY